MQALQLKEYTINSREVAKMVEKGHNDLLKDIRQYIEYLTAGNFPHSDFFGENQYKDRSGKTNPCYDVTRKGCEFIANKLTGKKGTIFTATYINRFHEMEKSQLVLSLPDKNKRLEIQDKNARARIANAYLKIADNDALPKGYRGIFLFYASKELSGQDLLPLPKSERKTYSATDVGAMFGMTANKIGRLANQYNLKTPEYGQLYHDKSPNPAKEVDSFRYFDTIILKLEEIIGRKAGVLA